MPPKNMIRLIVLKELGEENTSQSILKNLICNWLSLKVTIKRLPTNTNATNISYKKN